jgi:glycerophosphoryl diester phosphodiesterase
MNYWKQGKDNIYVAAHRGLCSQYPENTISAFRAALEAGVDQIETDIQVTKDGELVLIHDLQVDRTTNGTGYVYDFTFEELRKLDAGNGERIPTLRELMELVKDVPGLTLDLELKVVPLPSCEQLAYDVCDRTLAMVEEYGFRDRIVINTWMAKLHEYIYKKYGKTYRQHIFFPFSFMREYTIDPTSYAYCCCMFSQVNAPLNIATPAECEEMRAHGVDPWVGAAVKDEEGVDMAIQCGASLITCNNADEILAILRKKGYHK